MSSLKIKTPFLDMEWKPSSSDRIAAWELYIELLTRVSTQALKNENGDERAALASIYSIFETTREIIKRNGRESLEFAKLAVVILNQKIRPFTTKWHGLSLSDRLAQPEYREEFRKDLSALTEVLVIYTSMLADMADIEDIAAIE